jgi:hypothetical protein
MMDEQVRPGLRQISIDGLLECRLLEHDLAAARPVPQFGRYRKRWAGESKKNHARQTPPDD